MAGCNLSRDNRLNAQKLWQIYKPCMQKPSVFTLRVEGSREETSFSKIWQLKFFQDISLIFSFSMCFAWLENWSLILQVFQDAWDLYIRGSQLSDHRDVLEIVCLHKKMLGSVFCPCWMVSGEWWMVSTEPLWPDCPQATSRVWSLECFCIRLS